jgi:hypothetical protein
MVVEIQLPINPVPASRPRVTKQGWSYYAEPYKSFKDELKKLMGERSPFKEPIDATVNVTILIICEQPKKTKLKFPKPDWDNFGKAVCDAMNGVIIKDDSQIRRGTVEKLWAPKGAEGRIHIVMEVEP